jgi:uncharacterized protein (TIGR03435 family)
MRALRYATIVATVLSTASVVWQAVTATAQQESAHFDVVSIKPNHSGELGVRVDIQRGQVRMTNIRVTNLINSAYSVPIERIMGGPSWIREDRFDFVAKRAPTTSREESARMMRAMLAERFNLRIRREQRDQEVYVLRAAHAGVLGPRMKSTDRACTDEGQREAREAGLQPASCPVESRNGHISGFGVSMPQLATYLMPAFQDAVEDRTGLTGRYDIDLLWAEARTVAEPTSAPALPTALQEQLGLTVGRERVPREFVLVEAIERPTPD